MDQDVAKALEFEARLTRAEIMMATLDERTKNLGDSLRRIEDSQSRIEARMTAGDQRQMRTLGATALSAVGAVGSLAILILSHLLH